jgi:ribosomal protein S18 acetylase RimI-like enzyme
MNCKYCANEAIYRCSTCGKTVCAEHLKLRPICPACTKQAETAYTISRVTSASERNAIRRCVKQFWGEEEQLSFDRKFDAIGLPAYVAKVRNQVIGFISFAEADDTIIIVALGVQPKYQGSGVGTSLIAKVEAEAKRQGMSKLLVSTSNDDLPALAFYQRLGFQIYEVKPNVIAEKHGKILEGIGRLPIRDELRLQKILR